MVQFTKRWDYKWIAWIDHFPVFSAVFSSSYDGWAKCKEKVPDVSDPSQNVETRSHSKLKFTYLKDLVIKRVQKN